MNITEVAVIGTGVIGTGWIARLLMHGRAVRCFDPAPGFAETLLRKLESLEGVAGKLGAVLPVEGLTCCETLEDACGDVQWVQENAPENIDIKRALHAQIEAAAPADAVIASSSSGLLPTDIQAHYQYPQRILVGHPFNPVYLLPLVELVGGKSTALETIETARNFYAGIGMKPLHVRKEIEGYLSDRLQEALWREILHLVNDEVATTGELDEAIVHGPGLRWAIMGTCLTFHLAGGEGGMRHMLEQFGPALKLPWTKLEAPELTTSLIDRMVDGTSAQAGDRSIAELEQLRDHCLIEIMAVLEKYDEALSAQ